MNRSGMIKQVDWMAKIKCKKGAQTDASDFSSRLCHIGLYVVAKNTAKPLRGGWKCQNWGYVIKGSEWVEREIIQVSP